MRLVCPNCAAQYEVDANAIPEDGRDVQCANCGNTWFQEPGNPDEPAIETPIEQDTLLARPQATPVDQSVLDILRQEAELDASSRQDEEASADAPEEAPVEPSQEEEPEEPEGLALRARAARNRLTANPDRERRLHFSAANETGDVDDPSDPPTSPEAPPIDTIAQENTAEIAPAPQRQATPTRPSRDLPDVDTLNSSLRSAEDKSRNRDEESPRRGRKAKTRGRNLGFYLAVLISLILLALYALKPQIVAAIPEAAPYLDQYTDLVDSVRHRLANGVAKLIEVARNLLAQYT